ncbi:MAG: ABC transporter ATP-binding protein [Candidatus Bathyarchaeota archaeon]|jgi:ABC-2 type transport system ATP-binding protein|nr:ABC transporter ATP-binding protein [Candidatus Bathyarchaeota archaeon]
MPRIEADALTKRFGSLTAVDRLSFDVKEGEVFGLLGPNGAGKTTTVRMLACLILPSEGSGRVGGHDIIKDSMKIREIVGILTENPSLYDRLTPYENMSFFAQAYGLSDQQQRRSRIRELLDFFNLWERRNDKVGAFSKGMKQKLAIARTLVHEPPILLLDEPTSGLDPESAKEIRDLISSLSQRENHTILLCTHHLEDAERLCSRVMIINRGSRIIIGTPQELRNRTSNKTAIEISLKVYDLRLVQAVEEVEQVSEVTVDKSRGRLVITAEDPDNSTPEIVRRIVYSGGEILSVSIVQPSLEEAYLKFVKG